MLFFTKMQSLGNDFVLLDGVREPFQLEVNHIRRLANRHTGIGFDQLLVVESGQEGTDFSMRVFNTDGSEAEQCGNGARCFAKFVRDEGLTNHDQILVYTGDRSIQLEIKDEWQVVVDMGEPVFEPMLIPFKAAEKSDTYELEVEGENIEIFVVSFGNPHAVLLVDDITTAPLERLGPIIEQHPRFPKRTNVEFVCPVTRSRIQVRVWERGVGETLACGSGASAAAVACHRLGQIDEEIEVELPGGIAQVKWSGQGSLFLRGPATTVYKGQIDLSEM